MHYLRGKTVALTLLCIMGVVSLCDCADGYESPDGFDAGVNNEKLVTPDSLTFKVNADGTVATISWPLVVGAKGYKVTMKNIDDVDNPVVVDGYDGKVVDGCSMTATVAEDSKYSFTFQVLGDESRGNQDGVAKDTIFSTLVPSICTIPDGSDIYQFLKENLLDSLNVVTTDSAGNTTVKPSRENPSQEVAIELMPGGHYTMTGDVDFQYLNMTLRGNKVKSAFIEMTGNAGFYTYAGLKFKFLRIDMTQSTAPGLISMSNTNLPDSILSQNLGFLRKGSPVKGIYNIMAPIYISDVWVKNLPNALIYDNQVDCAWWNFTLKNCIIQCNNTNAQSFISFEKKGHGIKYITISNSTIYNIVPNSKAYFIRFANQSNNNPEKIWGNTDTEMASWYFTLSHVTLSKMFSGQKWANNINGTNFGCRFDHSIFYNLYQPFRRILERGYYAGMSSMKFNFFYNPDNPDDVDYTRKVNGAPCASLYDPQFAGDINKPLELDQPNGGIDFTPKETVILENNGGDTRWLPGGATDDDTADGNTKSGSKRY